MPICWAVERAILGWRVGAMCVGLAGCARQAGPERSRAGRSLVHTLEKNRYDLTRKLGFTE